jgi:hypothetical protein
MNKPNNPQAFPGSQRLVDTLEEPFKSSIDDLSTMVHFEGMTLRDYFAAKAMQGVIANYRLLKDCETWAKEEEQTPHQVVATVARKHADALLAELQKESNG